MISLYSNAQVTQLWMLLEEIDLFGSECAKLENTSHKGLMLRRPSRPTPDIVRERVTLITHEGESKDVETDR